MQLKHTNIHYILEQVGLTYNEAEVYSYLLEYGQRLGAEIYGDLRMDKSSCYRALKTLIDKDLVYKIGEERNQLFYANPVDNLEILIRDRENKLKQAKRAFGQFESLIRQISKESYQNKNVRIISTEPGYRQYLESRLKCKSKLIRELSGRKSAASFIPDYDESMTNYIQRRVKFKIFLRQLIPFGEIDDKWERTSREMNKEARELPKGFSAPASFSVWDDSIALFSKEKGQQIGVMIRDPLIAALMTSMFDFIWEGLKK